MSQPNEPSKNDPSLSELFAAFKSVVADNPHLQQIIRRQEEKNRQVLLNMSSVLRMVEKQVANPDQPEAEAYAPRVVSGWLGAQAEALEPNAQRALPAPASEPSQTAEMDGGASAPGLPNKGELNFFDRAFLKSLRITRAD